MQRSKEQRSESLVPYYHVAQRPWGWHVRKHATFRAYRTFATKAKALKFAHELVRRKGYGLFVHNCDGTIEASFTPNIEREFRRHR